MKSSTRIIEELCEIENQNIVSENSEEEHNLNNTENQPGLNNIQQEHHLSDTEKLFEVKLTDDALENHIASYANEQGEVDLKSIHDICHNKMHLSEEKSTEVATSIMNAAWYCGTPGVYYSPYSGLYGSFKPKDAFPVFLLAYDGGLYDNNGEFREDLFQILKNKYAIEDWDGEKLITKAKMKEFIEKETNQTERINSANWSYQKFAYNDVEFNAFFKKAVTRYIFNKETNRMEGYVNVSAIKLWYTYAKHQLDNMASAPSLPPEDPFTPAQMEILNILL